MSHPRPPRLERIFSTYDPPLFFVTACTANRQRFLTRETVKETIEAYARRGLPFRCAVGRYVLMPDHLHLFVQLAGEVTLSRWMKGLKSAIGTAVRAEAPIAPPIWQEGFFDHLIRQSESYEQKWHYVRDNPVRAGLVQDADDWPWQGEPTRIAL